MQSSSRGAVTLWTFEAVLSGWRASGGKRYSDVAILCAASLRAVFTMPLCQTQGFRTSLKNLLGPPIPVPHYSTLARRAAGLDVPQISRGSGIRACGGGPVHLAIGSPPIRLGGLKVFGGARGKQGFMARTSAPRHGLSDQWRNHGSAGCHVASSCRHHNGRDPGACSKPSLLPVGPVLETGAALSASTKPSPAWMC